MREDGKKYSLPTLHECVHENEGKKSKKGQPKLIRMSDQPGPIPISYEDIKFFKNKARSRSGLISRRHSLMAGPFSNGFDGREGSHNYLVEVGWCLPIFRELMLLLALVVFSLFYQDRLSILDIVRPKQISGQIFATDIMWRTMFLKKDFSISTLCTQLTTFSCFRLSSHHVSVICPLISRQWQVLGAYSGSIVAVSLVFLTPVHSFSSSIVWAYCQGPRNISSCGLSHFSLLILNQRRYVSRSPLHFSLPVVVRVRARCDISLIIISDRPFVRRGLLLRWVSNIPDVFIKKSSQHFLRSLCPQSVFTFFRPDELALVFTIFFVRGCLLLHIRMPVFLCWSSNICTFAKFVYLFQNIYKQLFNRRSFSFISFYWSSNWIRVISILRHWIHFLISRFPFEITLHVLYRS